MTEWIVWLTELIWHALVIILGYGAVGITFFAWLVYPAEDFRGAAGWAWFALFTALAVGAVWQFVGWLVDMFS